MFTGKSSPSFNTLGQKLQVALLEITPSNCDVLFVLIELFFRWCYGFRVLRANIGWKSAFLQERGQIGPKFQVHWVAPPNILLVGKLGWFISHLVQNVVRSFFVTHCTRLTNRQTDFDSKTVRMHSRSHGENTENLNLRLNQQIRDMVDLLNSTMHSCSLIPPPNLL